LLTAATQRLANRWLMREQYLISYDYADQSLEATLQALALRPNDNFIKRSVSTEQCAVADQRLNDGYPEEAFAYYRAAYDNDPLNLMALTGAVSAALQRGDLLAARQTMELASPGQREAFQYLIYQVILAVRQGEYGEARKACDEAASHGQESPTMHAYLGFLDLREGRRDTARQHFERALAIATTPMDALSDIVDLCASNGFASDARPYAERLRDLATAAIASDPGLPSLYSTRALAYSALGEQVLAARDMDSNRGLTGWWNGLGPSTDRVADEQ